MAFVNLEKLLPREKMLLGVCVLAVLLAVGNYLVVRRLHARLADLSLTIQNDSTRLMQNYAILAKKDEVQSEFNKIKAFVPPRPEGRTADALSTEVERLATACGVSLRDRKPQESTKVGFFEKTCVRFEMEGDRESLTKLLWRTESSTQLLRISKMEMTRNPRAGQYPLKAVLYVTAIAPTGVQ
jgi:Tfp pilus assembly protein PilO